MKRTTSLATAGVVVGLGLSLGAAPPAQAGAALGVKSLDVSPAADYCDDDTALPCTLGAGDGPANVLRVIQGLVDGHPQFTGFEGTSAHGTDTLWLAADIAAECRPGFRLFEAGFNTYAEAGDESYWGTLAGVWIDWVSVPAAKEMPEKRVAIDMPIGVAFGEDHHPSNVAAFFSEDAVLAYGEGVIADRVADGMTYAEARALPFHTQTEVSLTAFAACEGIGPLNRKRMKKVELTVPLHVQFEPVAPQGGGQDHAPAIHVATPAQVTDVDLAVALDPADPCVLELTGVIETNAATQVEYRYLDPFGQPSNTFTVDVGDGHEAVVETTVEVPGHDTPVVTETLVGDGPVPDLDELTWDPADGDTWSGTYTLQVLSPNAKSDITGFQVERCVAVGEGGEGAAGGWSGPQDREPEPVGPARPTGDEGGLAVTDPMPTPTPTGRPASTATLQGAP